MSWTTPPTFVASDPLAAADLNILGDDLVYLKGITDGVSFSGVSLQRSAVQSIPDSTNTSVTFTVEAFDYGSWFSSGTQAVVPAGAIPAGFTTIAVMCIAHAEYAANSTGTRRIRVLVNGSSAGGSNSSAVNGDTTDLDASIPAIVAAGDTIELECNQSSGGALNVGANVKLFIYRIAPVA